MSTEEHTGNHTHTFKTEVKQLLQILIHSLYKDQDIFLRELVSNASDALTRIQFEMLTNRDVLDADTELAIHIDVIEGSDEQPKKLVIKDSGVGMNSDELVRNLGTIAQSGAKEFLKKLSEDAELDPSDVIGQFGVGFYSVFMVADEVRVVSRSYQKDAVAAAWISDGSESFRVEAAEKADRGTEIHIILKKDAEEFANEWRLKQIVKKHSDFVRFPVFVGEAQANQQESIWRKQPTEVETAEYNSFYQQMTLDFEEPVAAVHFASDVPVHLRALLFVPAKREQSVLAKRKEPGVMLYSHNVMIQEYCTDLLPNWLNFVDGVVDSEDISLNVSRETVQSNRMMRQLAKTVRGRVLRELRKMSEKEEEKYAKFWDQFSRAFKEGIATDFESREEILPFLRYYSSKSDGKGISLDDYISRMPASQEEIYYVLGDDAKSVANSPHLDPFKARDIEVLYWVDPMDALIAPSMPEYKEKKFRNIDDAGLDLPELEESEAEESGQSAVGDTEFNLFVGRCVTTLGEKVIEVRASKVLKNSPVRLVSPKDAADRDTQRLHRYLDQDYEVPKKIMEVNRSHPLIVSLANLVGSEPDNVLIGLSIDQLYDSALVQEGLHPNPVAMLPRIQELMMLAAKTNSKE